MPLSPPVRTRWLSAVPGCILTVCTVACAPPSIRSAHSLDAGKVAFEVAGAWNATTADAFLLGIDGETTVEANTNPVMHLAGDATFRVGLGAGFELGASAIGAHAKYSILDERRHAEAPLSIAVTGQAGIWQSHAGLLFSKDWQGEKMGIRPVLNVLYSRNRFSLAWTMPDGYTTDEAEIRNPGVSSDADNGELGPGLYADMVIKEVMLPVGVEFPFHTSENWDVTPFIAGNVSIPFAGGVAPGSIECIDCLAGLNGVAMKHRAMLWVGIKFQPPLQRPTSEVTP